MRILFVHQSADLYGSDRTLLTLVQRLDRRRFEPIVVIPRTGPLSEALAAAGVETHVTPLLTLSRRSMTVAGFAETVGRAVRSLRRGGSLRRLRPDLIHSNTMAVLSGAAWAQAWEIPHVWHIHEIVDRPMVAAIAFRHLLKNFATVTVCCSHAVRRSIEMRAMQERIRVIYNGLDRPATDAACTAKVRRRMVDDERATVVLLAGRMNAWKGHEVLLRVASRLRVDPSIRFVLLGDAAPGQEFYETDLRRAIVARGLQRTVRLVPFERDVWPWWDACDIAVVPSTRPEPFGLVALEAMLAKRPVIASNLGGLAEVVDCENGILVSAGDEGAIAAAISALAADPRRRATMGAAGHLRATSVFSERAYVSAFERLYEELAA